MAWDGQTVWVDQKVPQVRKGDQMVRPGQKDEQKVPQAQTDAQWAARKEAWEWGGLSQTGEVAEC
jgi:hypothetical protein